MHELHSGRVHRRQLAGRTRSTGCAIVLQGLRRVLRADHGPRPQHLVGGFGRLLGLLRVESGLGEGSRVYSLENVYFELAVEEALAVLLHELPLVVDLVRALQVRVPQLQQLLLGLVEHREDPLPLLHRDVVLALEHVLLNVFEQLVNYGARRADYELAIRLVQVEIQILIQ